MLLARAGLDVLVVDRSRYGTDTLSTHALMRGGVVQLHRWGLLDAHRRRRHARRCAAPRSLRRRRACRSPSSRRTASTPSTRRGARCSTRSSSTPPPPPAPRSATARPSPASPATAGRVAGVEGRDGDGAPVRHRAGWVVGADGLRSVVAARVGAPSSGRAPAPPPSSTATGPGSTSTATSGSTGPAPAPALIPTNDGQTCVFAAATPAPHRPRRHRRAPRRRRRGVARAGRPARRRPRRRTACARFGGRARLPPRALGPGLGAGRRRRLLEGPDRRPRHHRRAPRRRAARPRHHRRRRPATADEAEAFADYHRTRDRLSLPLFDVVDTIAGDALDRRRDPGRCSGSSARR